MDNEISERDRVYDAAIEALENGLRPCEVLEAVEDAVREWRSK